VRATPPGLTPMIECIFTIDYEIYGNGDGSLFDLVYQPTENLRRVFEKHRARFVPFVEAAELEIIELNGTDSASPAVREQIRALAATGCTPALHLHPQWYNAVYSNGRWELDYSEYNLCTLSAARIGQIVDRALSYFQDVLSDGTFVPLSFRAGNWLFQPTRTAAQILASRGVKIDSSVFKGGVRHEHDLDYRRALSNGYFWRFGDRADVPDAAGPMVEFPIYARMIPFWQMMSGKRIGMERRSAAAASTALKKYYRLRDLLRFYHPLKFDFCRMTLDELIRMVDAVVEEDRADSGAFRPLVAIGHTKELSDLPTIDAFLSYLDARRIPVSTFEDIYQRCA
jgi:hypothetical protein